MAKTLKVNGKDKFHKILSKTLHKGAKICQQINFSQVTFSICLIFARVFLLGTKLCFHPSSKTTIKLFFKSYENHCQHRFKFQNIYNHEIYKKNCRKCICQYFNPNTIPSMLVLTYNYKYPILDHFQIMKSAIILHFNQLQMVVLMAPHQFHKVMQRYLILISKFWKFPPLTCEMAMVWWTFCSLSTRPQSTEEKIHWVSCPQITLK